MHPRLLVQKRRLMKTSTAIEDFYKKCGNQDIVIVMGDLNAKVGCEQDPLQEIVGKHGLGEWNDRWDLWVDWCTTHEQVIMTMWFQHHQHHLYTWKSPGDGVRNQIDYITLNKRFCNAITQVKGHPGADCGSDHVPIDSRYYESEVEDSQKVEGRCQVTARFTDRRQ